MGRFNIDDILRQLGAPNPNAPVERVPLPSNNASLLRSTTSSVVAAVKHVEGSAAEQPVAEICTTAEPTVSDTTP